MYDFLSGKNDSALDRLITRMKKYSEQEKYEEAANYRDTINLLLSLIKKVAVMSEPINRADAFIIITENGKKDYILLREGRLFIKDYKLDPNNLFETALDDYFDGTISLVKETVEKDLDRLKILLNWMSSNMEKTETYYLKQFDSISDLYTKINSN